MSTWRDACSTLFAATVTVVPGRAMTPTHRPPCSRHPEWVPLFDQSTQSATESVSARQVSFGGALSVFDSAPWAKTQAERVDGVASASRRGRRSKRSRRRSRPIGSLDTATVRPKTWFNTRGPLIGKYFSPMGVWGWVYSIGFGWILDFVNA